jgi:hypothetical protein
MFARKDQGMISSALKLNPGETLSNNSTKLFGPQLETYGMYSLEFSELKINQGKSFTEHLEKGLRDISLVVFESSCG